MLINSLLKNKQTIHSKTMDEDIIHLGSMTFQMPEHIQYSVIRVSKSHVARPDLISRIMYGTERYGDFLCKLNGISNPFEINEGDVLIVPSLTYVNEFMMTDTYNDDIDDEETTPRPKSKTEKRKANEAIVGDKRFKIDKENHVIIY